MGGEQNERDLAAELHAHRHDPEEWNDEAEHIEVRPGRTAVVSCRMPNDEFDALEQAAKAVGESLSQYVRRAISLRREGVRDLQTGIHVSIGNPNVQVSPTKNTWSQGVPTEQTSRQVSAEELAERRSERS